LKPFHTFLFVLATACLLGFGLNPFLRQTVAETLATVSYVVADSYPHPDLLPSQDWWITKVKAQAVQNQGQQYSACLFGDSISSGLKNSLAPKIVNFAMGGLSSVSLATQLKYLNGAGVRCQKAIIAIGTNDAWYVTSNETVIAKLTESLSLVRAMGANSIVMIPAFYSTLPASHDPKLAAPIERVDEINGLIQQVAQSEDVELLTTDLKPLYENHALKSGLTYDGVHLNEQGNQIYRQVLLSTLNLMP